jgi:hypothetical protein
MFRTRHVLSVAQHVRLEQTENRSRNSENEAGICSKQPRPGILNARLGPNVSIREIPDQFLTRNGLVCSFVSGRICSEVLIRRTYLPLTEFLRLWICIISQQIPINESGGNCKSETNDSRPEPAAIRLPAWDIAAESGDDHQQYQRQKGK